MIRVFKIIVLAFLVSLSATAQIFSGKILDSENKFPIKNATIVSIENSDIFYTNKDGHFKINQNGDYLIKANGYNEKIASIDITEFSIIYLTKSPSPLDEVIINATHLPKPLKKATSSIDVVGQLEMQQFNSIDFAPILNRTPGIFMQNGALNTNRITIRGIGSRNLFGTSKIRAYFKDIPLTNGSGETTIEDFELESISKMEIIKGATSSSYGAGLGGTILLKPKDEINKPSGLKNELTIGSFGLVKNVTALHLRLKNNTISTIYSTTNSDGYRNNNSYNRNTLTLATNHFLNEKNQLSVLASVVSLKAFIPSSLNQTDFINNPQQAAFTWQQAMGFEEADRGIIGLTWNHKFNTKIKQVTSIFTSFRDAYEPRPFNILTENSFAYGIRSRLIGTSQIFNKKSNFTFGGEFFRDRYSYKTFENLYEDFPPETGSVQGDNLSNFKENRMYYNVFFESDLQLSKKTTLTLGINLNNTSYKLKDNFETSENNPDQSGEFKFKSIISPKLGVSHILTDNLSIYSSISHGFSPISLNETLLPNGQINTTLKPESGWNFELGSRGNLTNGKLQYAFSIYRLNIKNLVVSRRTEADQFIGINAGKTRHDGAELKLNYDGFNFKKIKLSPFLTYTLNNFKFNQFIDGDSNFSGNDLTGVPDQIINLGLDFSFTFGLYGNLNYQYVGAMPITDSNSLYSNSYNLSNLKIGYKTSITNNLNVNMFLGINNMFNEHYASQILINASGFGGASPRYYYPGNPSNYYSGVRLNYVF